MLIIIYIIICCILYNIDLKIDVSTGVTPSKKEWNYTKEFSKSRPDEIIIKCLWEDHPDINDDDDEVSNPASNDVTKKIDNVVDEPSMDEVDDTIMNDDKGENEMVAVTKIPMLSKIPTKISRPSALPGVTAGVMHDRTNKYT